MHLRIINNSSLETFQTCWDKKKNRFGTLSPPHEVTSAPANMFRRTPTQQHAARCATSLGHKME